MVTKQQQLEWLAKAYKTWPEQGSHSLRLSAFEVGKFAIVNCHIITREEWQQERDKMSGKPEVDNSWHERGEFPPVGCECEMKHRLWIKPKEVKIAAITKEYVIVVDGQCEQHYYLRDITFRPLRTEREKAIDEMKSLCAYPGSWNSTYKSFAEALYDAGYCKVKP